MTLVWKQKLRLSLEWNHPGKRNRLFFFVLHDKLHRRPLPLTTVDLQKAGVRLLGLTSEQTMKVDILNLKRIKIFRQLNRYIKGDS